MLVSGGDDSAWGVLCASHVGGSCSMASGLCATRKCSLSQRGNFSGSDEEEADWSWSRSRQADCLFRADERTKASSSLPVVGRSELEGNLRAPHSRSFTR
jgi:hypothetical protein